MDNRLGYFDIAKGLAILLVVVYHSLEGIISVFDLPTGHFIYALAEWSKVFLMPTFFFVSGCLAQNTIVQGNSNKIINKIKDLLYLYIIWSCIIYISRLSLNSITNTNMAADEIVKIFWDPLPTIWFVYALVIAFSFTYLVRGVNRHLVIVFAIGMNILNQVYPSLFEGFILERVCWLLLYYLIGFYYFHEINTLIRENSRTALGFVAIFVLLSLTFILTDSRIDIHNSILLSLLFGFGFLSSCLVLEHNLQPKIVLFLRNIGAACLFIYLTHFPIPAATRLLLMKLDLYSHALSIYLTLILAISLGLIAQHFANRSWCSWLFFRPRNMIGKILGRVNAT